MSPHIQSSSISVSICKVDIIIQRYKHKPYSLSLDSACVRKTYSWINKRANRTMAEKKVHNLSAGKLMKYETLLTLKKKKFPKISGKIHLWGSIHWVNLLSTIQIICFTQMSCGYCVNSLGKMWSSSVVLYYHSYSLNVIGYSIHKIRPVRGCQFTQRGLWGKNVGNHPFTKHLLVPDPIKRLWDSF